MAQKTKSKTNKRKLILYGIFVILIFLQMVLVSAEDKNFEEILKPLTTIYNLVKYAATLISGLMMLFAGITYISSGSDPGKREKAKNMVMYVIIGLIVIWAAPFIVELVIGS